MKPETENRLFRWAIVILLLAIVVVAYLSALNKRYDKIDVGYYFDKWTRDCVVAGD